MSRHAATRGHRFLPGLLAVAALTSAALSVTTYMATADTSSGGSQCEPLPVAPTPSPSTSASASPNASSVMLCVSVQPSKSSVARGHVAHFTVQVQALNGAVPDVTVTLAASAGSVTFTGYCPSGDGTASCQLGSLGTDVTPSLFTLSAGIGTPSSGAAWVSLTASASAATNPATSAQATGVVTVTAATTTAASGSAPSAPSRPAASPAATVVAQPSAPVGTPIAAPSPTAAAASTSAVPAENVGSEFPVITPTSSPAVTASGSPGTSPTPATSQPAHSSGGSSALAIAGSWVCGLLALVLAGYLALTRRRH
jgi:DNA segregation ATPase FtsK/SpoIIIE, S-DNA-T family